MMTRKNSLLFWLPFINVSLITIACLILWGCAPIIHSNGYLPSIVEVKALKIGGDGVLAVKRKLGSPLVEVGEKKRVWVYFTQNVEALAFLEPKVVSREILLVNFDSKNVLKSTERYELDNSRVIDLNKKTVVTEGRKLSFLQQVFGNLGNFTSEQFAD